MNAPLKTCAKRIINPPIQWGLRGLLGAMFRPSRRWPPTPATAFAPASTPLGEFLKRIGRWFRNQVYLAYVASAGERYFCHDTKFSTYVVNLADDGVSREIFLFGNFDVEIFQRALQVLDREGLDRPQVLLDVGANIGTVSIHALMTGAFIRAIGIEANSLNARLLRANVCLNGLEDKMTVIEGAAAGEPNLILNLELAIGNLGDHRIRCQAQDGVFGEGGRDTESVRSVTVDSVLAKEGIDPKKCLLWMDVQGYEGEVLLGARRLLMAGSPMVFELWPYGLRRANTYDKLVASLAGYSYFIDLRDPLLTRCSLDKLHELYKSFPDTYAHTDILAWK
jgi:FkbM family methyltransferase